MLILRSSTALAVFFSLTHQAATQAQPLDLICATGKHAATWQSVKKRFRDASADGRSLLVVPTEQLVAALGEAKAELEASQALAADAAAECGMGKLSMQLLSLNTIEDSADLSQLFSGVERLASPVMTLILEVPWLALAQSGWPIFGLLAQVNQRRVQSASVNPVEVDGLDGKFEPMFLRELFEALARGDSRQLDDSSRVFMSLEGTTRNALATLSSVAGQAAADRPPQEKLELLEQLQNGFRQAIGSAPELDIALGTQWPLFGLIQFVLDQLAI